MKKLSLIFVLTMATTAFAQQNSVSTNVSKVSDRSQKGLYVGVDYMNITDVHMNFTSKSSYRTYSDKTESGTHLGMGGVTIGYNQTPEKGIGFSAGVRLLESFNTSEYGSQKLDIIIPEGNVTLAANKYLTGFAGINASVWTGGSEINKYKTQLGGQAGLGVRFNKNVAVNAGYTIMNQKLSEKTSYGSEIDLEIQASGFSSNLVYTF